MRGGRDVRDGLRLTTPVLVAEGNRRLAAVLLLRDEQLRKKIGATDLPKIGSQQRAALDQLPVSIYQDKEELWQYFGFRHINGPKAWDAFAKAKYVADVYEKYGIPLEKIARTIGDRHSFVKRIYRGYRLLHQAETQTGFSRDDIMSSRFAFSHLYTAADQPDFQKFLGVAPDSYDKPNPAPKSKLEELHELMTWLYGSRSMEKPPIVRTQNPDLNLLRVALSKPQALAALRAGYSLERAYQIGTGDKVRFRESLTRAKEELQQASATAVTGYAGEKDLLTVMEDLFAVAQKLKLDMEEIRLKPTKTGRSK